MNLIFLGPPGAGKGTQARLLSERQRLPQISTGDMLRAAIQRGSDLGQEAERYVRRGDLVPDAVMIGIVAERLQQDDARTGFVLDGFPRTIAQAEGLEAVLKGLGRGLDQVIYFEADEAILVQRLSGRIVCRAQGHIYHADYRPPKTPGLCDIDGSEVFHRDDDQPETVQHRLRVYREQTQPLLEFYRARSLLSVLKAGGDVEDTHAKLMALVDTRVTR